MTNHYDIATSALLASPQSAILTPLHQQLWSLLQPPVYSEYLHLLDAYATLLSILPTWPDLPLASKSLEMREIRYTLTISNPELATESISKTHLTRKYWIWSTLDKFSPYPDNSKSGMLGIILQLAQGKNTRLAFDLASALRGSTRSRQPTVSEKNASVDPTSLSIVLDSIALGSGPREQIDCLWELIDAIEDANPSFPKLLRKLDALFPRPSEQPDWTTASVDTLVDESIEADGPDEELGEDLTAHYSSLLDRPDATVAVQRAHHQQAIWSANRLLLQGHVSALTQPEAEAFSAWLLQQAEAATSRRQAGRATALLLTTLVLVTGRTLEASTHLLQNGLRAAAKTFPNIDPERGLLWLPAPIPRGAFEPDPEQQAHLKPTLEDFALHLPPRLANIIKRWSSLPVASTDSSSHKEAYAILEEYRKSSERDVSWGRVRQWIATRLMTLSKDPALIYWITGDTQGQSTGHLYYAQIQAVELAKSYSAAVWPLFESDPPPTFKIKGAVGSKAVPQTKYVAGCVASILRRFSTSQFSVENPGSIADRHNLLVDYVTAMLTAVAGHRISSSLLTIRRGDICLSLDGKTWHGAATFGDKRTDAEHFFRPVAIGSHVAEQIGLYLLHLHELQKHLSSVSGSRTAGRRVQNALTGQSPLFFELDKGLAFREIKFDDWHDRFKSHFADLPSNFGRHNLATELRTQESTKTAESAAVDKIGGGELACLALGHFSIIGHPFGSDSPSTIIQMAEALGPTIDDIYNQQCWERRGGLTRPPKRFKPCDVPHGLLKLRNWSTEHQNAKSAIKSQVKRIEKKRKENFEDGKHVAREEFLAALTEIKPLLSKHLEYDEIVLPKPKQPFSLTAEELYRALSTPPSNPRASEKERATAMRVRLQVARDILKKARAADIYQGPMPARTFVFRSGEQTPLVQNVYQAYDTILSLRSQFTAALPDLSDRALRDDPTRLLAHFALAVVLYGSVTDQSRLLAILRKFRDYQRCPAYPEAVLIELDTPPPTTWPLFGIPAALVGKMTLLDIPTSEPDELSLSKTLWAILPADCRPDDPGRTLEYLLETAGLAAVIELSGIARQALDKNPSIGSWALPLERQLALMRGEADQRPASATITSGQTTKLHRRPTLNGSDWHTFLCKAIPSRSTKQAKKSGHEIGKVETNRLHRKAAARQIIVESEQRTLIPIEQALGHWVVQMLLTPKSGGGYAYSYGTVHTYLTSIAASILSKVGAREIAEIEDDEWADVYGAILSGYREGTLNRKLLLIQRFHQMLKKRFGATDLLEECLPEKAKVKATVRNSLALPAEIRSAHDLLRRTHTDQHDRLGSARIMRQARVALTLAAATGCRIGEIMGLQFRDIRLTPEKGCSARVRVNQFRDIKTKAAARIIPFALSESERAFVQAFVSDEKSRLGSTHYRPTRLVFLELSRTAGGTPLGTDTLRPLLTGSLRASSPITLITYDIRHTHGTRFQAEMALSTQAIPTLSRPTPTFELPQKAPDSLRLGRHTQSRAMVFGHARPQTTNHSYGGMPWLYLVKTGQDSIRYLNQEAISRLLGLQLNSARSAKAKNSANFGSWVLNQILPMKLKKKTNTRKAQKTKTLAVEQATGIPAAVVYLCNAHDASHELKYRAYGLSDKQYAILQDSCQALMAETRFALLRSLLTNSDYKDRSTAPPRWYPEALPLLRLTESMGDATSTIWDIAATYRQIMTPNQPQGSVILTLSTGADLVTRISQGAPDLEVTSTSIGSKMAVDVGKGKRPLTRHLAWILTALEALRPLRR